MDYTSYGLIDLVGIALLLLLPLSVTFTLFHAPNVTDITSDVIVDVWYKNFSDGGIQIGLRKIDGQSVTLSLMDYIE